MRLLLTRPRVPLRNNLQGISGKVLAAWYLSRLRGYCPSQTLRATTIRVQDCPSKHRAADSHLNLVGVCQFVLLLRRWSLMHCSRMTWTSRSGSLICGWWYNRFDQHNEGQNKTSRDLTSVISKSTRPSCNLWGLALRNAGLSYTPAWVFWDKVTPGFASERSQKLVEGVVPSWPNKIWP